MIISDKQIMQLMGMCRSYAKLCAENDMYDEHERCKELHREIEKQQSEKLFEVKDTPTYQEQFMRNLHE